MSQKSQAFRFIDLFAGIGGFRLALQELGGACVFSCEKDRFCAETYAANFGDDPLCDISTLAIEKIPEHDFLVAGFPCQPFSLAGVSKKNSLGRAHGFADQTQGTLFFNLASIIREKKPEAFLLENVKNLKSHDGGRTFSIICGALTEMGYSIFAEILDAAAYVPQHRERIFIAGFRRDLYGEFPEFNWPHPPLFQRPALKNILEPAQEVPARHIISDKLWEWHQNHARQHRKKGNGFGYGLAHPEGQTRTLSARYYKDGAEILVPVENSNPRLLTPRECARLMGFPDSFQIHPSRMQSYKQFGNSVVVPLVQAIAGNILHTMRATNQSEQGQLGLQFQAV